MFNRKPKPLVVKVYQHRGFRAEKIIAGEFERDAAKMAERGYRIEHVAPAGGHEWGNHSLTVTYRLEAVA